MQNLKKCYDDVHFNINIYWISTSTLWNSTTIIMLIYTLNAKVGFERLRKLILRFNFQKFGKLSFWKILSWWLHFKIWKILPGWERRLWSRLASGFFRCCCPSRFLASTGLKAMAFDNRDDTIMLVLECVIFLRWLIHL